MSIRYDNTLDFLSITTNVIDYNSPYSVCGWFYISVDTNATSTLIALSDGTANNVDVIRTTATGTTIESRVVIAAAATTIGATDLAVATWHHIAMVRRSATVLELYIDGRLDSTNTRDITGRAASSNFRIGKGPASQSLNGLSSFVRAWTKDLTLAQINVEMRKYKAAFKHRLYGDWPMIGPSLNIAALDRSGRGNHWLLNGTLNTEVDLPVKAPKTVFPYLFIAQGAAVVYDKTGGFVSPVALSGADLAVFNDTAGVVSPGKLSGADVNTFNETSGVVSPGVLSGADTNVFNDTAGVKAPGVLASADNSVVFNETGGAKAPGVLSGQDHPNVYNKTSGITTPAVLSGSDANVFSDTGGVVSPGKLSGADSNVFNDAGGVTSPGVLSGADANVFNDTAGIISPAVISGADNFITVETGGWTSPAVLSGTSQANQVYTKTGGVTTPAVLSGFDNFVSTDTGGFTTPAVLSGQSSANQVYVKTGGFVMPAVMSGTDSTVYNDTASATAPAVMSGSDVTIFNDTAGAVTPAVLSGIDVWESTHTGGFTSPAVLSGTHDAGPVAGHGGSTWLPYPVEPDNIEVTHGRTQREREGATLDDDDEAMLLLF